LLLEKYKIFGEKYEEFRRKEIKPNTKYVVKKTTQTKKKEEKKKDEEKKKVFIFLNKN
jgi:hypothetical protein